MLSERQSIMLAFNVMSMISYCSILSILVISFVALKAHDPPSYIQFFVVLLTHPLLSWTTVVFAYVVIDNSYHV